MASNDPIKRYRTPSSSGSSGSPRPRKQPEANASTPRIKALRGSMLPETERLKKAFLTLNRARQVLLLVEIAKLPTPDSIEVKSWPVGNESFPLSEGVYPWPSEKRIRSGIALTSREAAKLSGKPMRTRQLLDLVLHAVESANPTADFSEKIWSEAERANFSALRTEPLEIQRGQLAALQIYQNCQISRHVPESAADALCCLLVDTAQPRTQQAKSLLDAHERRRNELAGRYKMHRTFLTERLIELGVRKMIVPTIKTTTVQGKAMLDMILAKDDQFKFSVIQSAYEDLIKRRGAGEALEPTTIPTMNQLELFNEALQQCGFDKQVTEGRTMTEQLISQLVKHLPDSLQAELYALLASPDCERRDQEILTLLRSPITSTDKLLSTLKTDAELFEALQIVWGGAPVFSLGFARNLSEMLLFAGDRYDLLMREVESKLVTRLGPDKLAGYAIAGARVPGSETGRAELVVSTITRMLTPPTEDEPESKLQLAEYGFAVTPPSRSHEPMLAWLETKKSQALVDEVAQRNPRARRPTGAKAVVPPLTADQVKAAASVGTPTSRTASPRGSRPRQT
jgi:hypothetical protein